MTDLPLHFDPTTSVVSDPNWHNFHGTITNVDLPCLATIDAEGPSEPQDDAAALRQGHGVSSVLDFCFNANPPEPLRVMGTKWSLSEIIRPHRVAVDNGRISRIRPVDTTLFDKYPYPETPETAVPVIVGGGALVIDVNDTLGKNNLALQTSGAGSGHHMAGCIATGTHGSAIGVGAVHDTVRAMYLIVEPKRAVLVQSGTRPPFNAGLAKYFEGQTGIPTQLLSDDDVFAAALVGLGSLGFVHSVVVEAVPLYQLSGKLLRFPLRDTSVLNAMDTMDFKILAKDNPQQPHHFQVLVNPYASDSQTGFYVTLLWKGGVGGKAFAGPSPTAPMAPGEIVSVIGWLGPALKGVVGDFALEEIINGVLSGQNPAKSLPPQFPGQFFGNTNLPPAYGQSTEIVVDGRNASRALLTVLDALNEERAHSRHLLGAIGVRFVPKTQSLLGMNIHDMNCYMELASVESKDVPTVHAAAWAALDKAGIPYTCHWGQQHKLTSAHLKTYFGDRVERWKAARDKLLPTPTAKAVFTAPSLIPLGLGG